MRFLFIILFSAAMLEADAQTASTDSVGGTPTTQAPKKSFVKRVGDFLNNYYFKTKYDTNYVERPRQKWLLRPMVNQTGNFIHAKGIVNDVYSKYDLHTKRNTTLCLEVNYCDIAASLSLNPAKLSGSYNDYEFNFEYHGQKISFDINYQRASSLAGDIHFGNVDHLDEDGLHMNVVNVTAYYTFNHRKFSYPAALYQNYYQLRSAGSWLAGASFQGGSIRTTAELKERSPLAPVVHLSFSNVSIGGGYGYNWVFGGRSQWLLHLSALPTFVVYKHNKLNVNEQEIKDSQASFNMIFNERAAVVYHFTPRYHTGASFMMSNSVFDNSNVVVRQNKWLARVFFGIRF